MGPRGHTQGGSLLLVLEGDLGDQLPALAVSLVGEALAAQWTPSGAAPPRPAQAQLVTPAGTGWGVGVGGCTQPGLAGAGRPTDTPSSARPTPTAHPWTPAHRVIQVQVGVKLGDEVVARVQLGHFPREPEDFGGCKGRRWEVERQE